MSSMRAMGVSDVVPVAACVSLVPTAIDEDDRPFAELLRHAEEVAGPQVPRWQALGTLIRFIAACSSRKHARPPPPTPRVGRPPSRRHRWRTGGGIAGW